MTGTSALSRAVMSGYFWLLVAFLYAPIAVVVLFSLNDSTIAAFPLTDWPTTEWYRRAFDNEVLIEAMRRSAVIALMNAALATLLGLAAAMGLSANRLRLRGAVTALIMLPLVVPYVVLGIALLILLKELGYDQTLTAVLAAHIVVTIPYSVLVILPRLRTLDASLVEAARDLGATELSAFLRVTLPLILPAILSSALIAFIISFDEYAIASFLVPPGESTFPVFLYGGSRTPDLRPQLLAIASVVIVISLVLVVIAEVGRQRAERRLAGVD
jgi:spermidine/putrescine transport system permease protein